MEHGYQRDNSFVRSKSNESLRLMLIIFLFVFIASSPIWLTLPYKQECSSKIRDPCIEGKSKLCDAEELCCRSLNSVGPPNVESLRDSIEATILPGQFIFVNCTNNNTVLSTCNNGVLSNLNNCTLS